MALTRAQLLMGDTGLGAVLPGQVQGVRQGAGITIATDGTISVNSQTVTGLMKMGQTAATANAAYNSFVWPTAAGAIGQQLTIANVAGGITTLAWDDPDGIPWTQKGQIVAATGAGSANQTLVNVGTDGQILIADSGTASGLNYTSNYVATGGATTAAYMPAGNTAARPNTPPAGSLRYNSQTTSMEFYVGPGWETIASSATGNFVEQTSSTGSAIMPAGNTAARDSLPGDGFTRFNTDSSALEFFDGTNWIGVGGGIPDLGLNLNTVNSLLKAVSPYDDAPPIVGTGVGQAINGSLYWDVDYGAMFIRYTDTTPTAQWVMINGSNLATGPLDFPAGPIAGTTYAAPNGLTYTYDATKGVWTCPSGGAQVGLGLETNGGFIKVSIPVASTPPAAGTGAAQAMDGSLYWDDVLGALFIRYDDGTTTQWVQTTPSGGGVSAVTASAPLASSGGNTPNITAALATAAQAAAGTSGLVLMTPQFTVPKDASGMTGAAILPSGTDAERAAIATLVVGMQRYNTDSGFEEVYTGATGGWKQLAYVPTIPVLADKTVTNGEVLKGEIYCNNFTVPAGITCTVAGSVYVAATGNATIAGTVNGNGNGQRGAGQVTLSISPTAGVLYNGTGRGVGGGFYTAGGQEVSPVFSLLGGGGSGGFYRSSAASAGLNTPEGGTSGASFMLRCLGTVSVTGTVTMNGATAASPGSPDPSIDVSGGGGGSGGLIILDANLNCTNSGTLSANGGDGAVGVNNANGGGGGGGGWIIVQSRTATATLGTTSVAAGSGALPNNGAFLGAGGGGGFGGPGGNTQTNGTVGKAQTYGSPLV